ncbi:MAG: malectin domain-containing carbohydrate-binding protein [Rikenellaceae bacterium]|nr:malectin domain-containing carbohydrate-binding protein [Rikenellaceae bacterium]
MKRLLILLAAISCTLTVSAQRHVSQERMAEVYEEARTPYKYGLVIAPTTNKAKIDCPTVFQENGRWYMTYVLYNGQGAKDGRGYETWLAESDNLLEWRTLGRVLEFRDGTWDENQRGGFLSLVDMEWGGSYALQKFKNRRWMTYIGGAGTGYEAVNAPLNVGLAWTKKDPTVAHNWESLKTPLLSINDEDVQWWESLVQYKSMVYWDRSEMLGAPFVMYYNAGGKNPETGYKGERIGIALSKDMKKWERYEGNPIFSHEAQGTITGDAQIAKMGDLYVMFYFSAFNPSRNYLAYNTFACSYDMVTWDDWQGDDLIYPTKSYDEMFAHKSFVVKHDGVVYHFYCAVNNDEQRGIAVATSRPMGRSKVHFPAPDRKQRRTVVELEQGWTTWLEGKESERLEVSVPHNWDDYYGYRQLIHGNLHGTAHYETTFESPALEGKRAYLHFEGVGTYATITLNGHTFAREPIGRTVLSLDVTPYLKPAGENRLEVKAEHPELIADMPWICGGCSSEVGFSEGSQPLGIFRPVKLEVTDEIRIEPFGVHIWNEDDNRTVHIRTELKNYSDKTETVQLVNKFATALGAQVFRLVEDVTLAAGETKIVEQSAVVENAHLWSPEDPYLYKLATMIKREGGKKTTDEISTPYGIRTFSWPVFRQDGDNRFYVNGKPTFINGVCEYEHQFGQSHAFSDEQVIARVKQMRAAGFNAFRDAHQPHNLIYQDLWDKHGILFWTQLSAHVWYDTPEFRKNFKTMLRRWVKERRNSPSVMLWGLQNESVLPRDFSEECVEIIREMDPTSATMRPVTTCNGGVGTDWNVVQNWSGTYGGDLFNYGNELSSPEQLLNGEYGAWRTTGFHCEPTAFDPAGAWTETRMTQLMETKVRLANENRDRLCGQYQWIYSSHDNPGRRQPEEGYRLIDKVGPFNNKGLVTPWEEPNDVYYMYRANFIDAKSDPMVYLASHTWPERFEESGPRRATIEAYSNCDSVLLYNDAVDNKALFLGRKIRKEIGTHFTWEHRKVRYNVLRAVGYHRGKAVAEDVLVLKGLEKAPNFEVLYQDVTPMVEGDAAYNYLYRVNCGGDSYTDTFGQKWDTDDVRYSRSWSADFKGLSPYQASQRTTFDPIRGTRDWPLFQSFRFGRHKLNYRFAVPDGNYRIELYFVEPWHGTGGSWGTDCEGLRIFDVAVNGERVVDDLDIWAEKGHDGALKVVVEAEAKDGELKIDFPEVKAGQAVISAIAVATSDKSVRVEPMAASTWSWAAADKERMDKTPKELLPAEPVTRPTDTYEAEAAAIEGKHHIELLRKREGVFFDGGAGKIEWTVQTGLAQVYAFRFKYVNLTGQQVPLRLQLIDPAGTVLRDQEILLPDLGEKWRVLSTTSGSYINAGKYRIIISGEEMKGLAFESLDVQ